MVTSKVTATKRSQAASGQACVRGWPMGHGHGPWPWPYGPWAMAAYLRALSSLIHQPSLGYAAMQAASDSSSKLQVLNLL